MHVITFGQTKPGGTMLAKRIKNATTRWMNRYMISKVNFRPNLNVSSSFSIFHRRIENCADPSTQLPQDTSRFTHVDDSLLIYPANMAWKSNLGFDLARGSFPNLRSFHRQTGASLYCKSRACQDLIRPILKQLKLAQFDG